MAHRKPGINNSIPRLSSISLVEGQISVYDARNNKGPMKIDMNGKTQPADTPRSEASIQNGAIHHLNKGSEVAEVTATITAENFRKTVDAIVEPHEAPGNIDVGTH